VLDDRNESAGVKFSDADLLGFPIRITISKKLEEKKLLEIKLRKNKDSITINKNKILDYLKKSEN
jgi:prolyl-tRNA synthetase